MVSFSSRFSVSPFAQSRFDAGRFAGQVTGALPPPPPPPGASTRASITTVQADGWRATDTAPIVFDPVGAPEYVVAISQGHDAAGSATTVTREIPIMARVRQPSPNEGSLSANDVTLAEHVYAGDTIVGVTNNATLSYRKPICAWLNHDLERASGTVTVRLAVAHWEARNGRPVAAVNFKASDGVNADVVALVTSMTSVSYSESGLSVPVFEATLDLSSLNEGLVTIDADIRPWVGTEVSASTDFAAYPSVNFCELKVFNVKTAAEATIYAYCDPAGDNGTGVASTTAATALANPFLTVAAAAAAIETLDGADASRGVIRLNAGTYTQVKFQGVAVGETPLVIEASTPANRATTIYQDAGVSQSNGIPDKLKFKDVTLHKTGGNAIFLDNAAGAGSSNMLVFENCAVTGSGAYGAWVYKSGRFWAINSDLGNVGVFQAFSSVNKMGIAIGSTGQGNWNAAYNLVASKLSGNWGNGTLAHTNRETPEGTLIASSFLTNNDSGTPVYSCSEVIGPAGLALVGTVVEDQDGGSATAAYFNADNSTDAAQNVVVQGCTVVGQRTNFLYNDTTPYAVKTGQIRFSVLQKTNTKSDVFESDGTAVNNWSAIHKVGWRRNAYLQGDSSGSADYGAGNWIGEFAALGDVAGFGTSLNPDWADDQSGDGGGSGDGDYTPGGATDIPTYGDAALLPYSHDLNGTALSASSHVGAIG